MRSIVWFPDGVPVALGAAVGFSALAYFYAFLGSHYQLWVDGFHIHHLYFGLGGLVIAGVLWKCERRWWALFFLGLSVVLIADGFARIYLGLSGPWGPSGSCG